MIKNQFNQDLYEKEVILKNRYTNISKFLIFISLMCLLFIIVIFMGVYVWENPYNWAILGLSEWLLILSAVLGFTILINLFIIFKFGNLQKRIIKSETYPPEFIDGKKVHSLTFPKGSAGGIFSKTYVSIDGHNILKLRIQMIKPNELWKKEGKNK